MLRMMKSGVGLCLVVVALLACDGRGKGGHAAAPVADTAEVADDGADVYADELMDDEPMPVAAEELFDDFIFNFASNRRLQLDRIDFPLTVDSGSKTDTIERDEWSMEPFFMHQGEYTLIFDDERQMELVKDTTVCSAMVEKIFLNDDFVRQYLFSRIDGSWRLTQVRNQTLPRNPNASFLAFYQRFVSDSVFQRQSLSNEMAFSGPDPDDDFAQMEGVITPDFWDAFAPELPQRTLYNIVYGAQNNPAATEKIFVLRGIANGLEMAMTFRLDGGRWKLTKLTE